MSEPKSPMLESQLPTKWQPKFILKRIDEDNLTITKQTRDDILHQLAKGAKYVQIGEYTVMINAIRSIDPFWGAKNVPPRPEQYVSRGLVVKKGANTVVQSLQKNPEYEEWMQYFGKKLNQLEWENK